MLYSLPFGQKSSKLNSRPVYCSQLYGNRNFSKNIDFTDFIKDLDPICERQSRITKVFNEPFRFYRKRSFAKNCQSKET